jgi:uncharacterized tellurite resistance protein B-like protein
MNPTIANTAQPSSGHEAAATVRRAVRSLNDLDAATAEHLNALAFILIRVARADGRVCSNERERMEEILVEHARISAEHAVLVTEIACHKAQLADCGTAYGISRGLRTDIGRDRRESVVLLLSAVAAADGHFAAVEMKEILQIAGELGISHREIEGQLPVPA